MDWESPLLLLLILPALAFLLWAERRSSHPMSAERKRILLLLRALGVILALTALAGPARIVSSSQRAVVLVLDQTQSLGNEGRKAALERLRALEASLPGGVSVSRVGFGDEARLLKDEDLQREDSSWITQHGGQSNYAASLDYARALFPAGTARHVILIGDGHETRGSLLDAAQQAAVAGVRLHAAPVAGPRQPDVRVAQLTPNQSRLHEGAALRLTADIQSTLDGRGLLRLFENGIEVERRNLTVKAGQAVQETFTRHPPSGNIYKYRAVVSEFPGDAIPANDEALTLVEVRGRLRLLYLEGEPAEAAPLLEAMEKEGIQLELRAPDAVPATPQELGGYDGIILSDVPAHKLGARAMTAMRDYVDKLGGGLLMLGGPASFGTGGYYRTPIEEVLPLRLKPTDEEEKQNCALALVIDRSGSMAGEKLEMAKSAAIATAEILTRNDSIGVYAFDSELHVVVPMTRLSAPGTVTSQIAGLTSGGGTNAMPAMVEARSALQRANARIKHMIVLTDGQTSGTGYEALASQCRSEGMTISTVAIGEGAHVGFLQALASLGGGQSYNTLDASSITRVFTQDTLIHTGRMIREDAIQPQLVEKHVMLAGLDPFSPPPLLGYVKTRRKTSAQTPLLTDLGDPLLAHWRFGLGKVTAFTSDAKPRWAGLWIARWEGYGRFWSQVLRETARPPQGQGMDLRAEMHGDEARLSVDVLADAGTRAHEERVTAEVFFVPASALGSPLQPQETLTLRQSGPGLYEGGFRPDKPGIYLIRAQSGPRLVTAGLVHNPGGEQALGTVNEPLLRRVTQLTSGTYLEGNAAPDLGTDRARRYIELWPPIVLLLLAVFLADVAVRRWEHVTGIFEMLTGWVKRSA